MEKENLIAISQPSFFPWSGYFDLIDSVNIFVFLNDVKFSKQSWQIRNKIFVNKKSTWINLPIVNDSSSQLVNETKIINNKNNINKILKTISQNYSKSKYYKTYYDEFEKKLIECSNYKFLDDLNIEMIKWFLKKIEIKTQIFKSSDLDINGNRSFRISKICEKFKTFNYLSAYGALDYLKEDFEIFKEKKINVFLQNYEVAKYNQFSESFDGFVSILDMLFNEGPKTLSIIRKSRKNKISLLEKIN
tara:strand:+ start:5705 stop:6445 length:741 start_codon:yes stop_codon:yes gene_type:complete